MALIGINAPYLLGDYGHDLAPSARHPDWPVRFDPMHAYRPLIEARALGLGAVRVWLCENGEGILTDARGSVTGVHADLLEAVRVFQEAAALHGMRLYWSLLDGNAVAREGDPLTRSILADRDQSARFAERVVAPIAALLDPATTVALEIVNEPETATAECIEDSEEALEGIEPVSWDDIGATLRDASAAAAAEGVAHTSAGTMHVFLPSLWKTEPGLGAIDVHVYHARGGLPTRQDLATYMGDDTLTDATLPLIGGECGIPKEGQHEDLLNYVHNADAAGYDALFLWQLEGDMVDHRDPRRPITHLGWDLRRLLI